jgi:hypothetical protein
MGIPVAVLPKTQHGSGRSRSPGKILPKADLALRTALSATCAFGHFGSRMYADAANLGALPIHQGPRPKSVVATAAQSTQSTKRKTQKHTRPELQ